MKLFSKKPVLDQASATWIIDIFEWSLRHFDQDIFNQHTSLVIPDNRHFPGRADSIDGMAGIVLEKVLEHAGMSHWPCKAVNQMHCGTLPTPEFNFSGGLRKIDGVTDRVATNKAVVTNEPLFIPFDPSLVRQPEALIASLSHGLAQYLAAASGELPPGGEENWIYATEVIAVFLGFGLMLCNTAVTHQIRSCASCAPRKTYSSALSQFDLCYALAVFCALKKIPVKAVVPHLKRPLRSYFKKALREVQATSALIVPLHG